MLRSLKISPSHEDLFIERYASLRAWALRLTDQDCELAEDLLHDAFIQFATLTRPDLKAINNLDGYLYGMLRNLHLSQERRSSRGRFQQLTIVEYESAETGLRTVEARDLIRVQDDLRQVCHYACLRKEHAKLASVLILRFFHGYYPSEIARVIRSPRAAVDKWLQLARAEAKLAITAPQSLRLKGEDPSLGFMPTGFARTTEELLGELRQLIFGSRRSPCSSAEDLHRFYSAGGAPPIDCVRLAHIVSCRSCLDEINKMLKLPPLSERYPTDSIGKDTPPKGGTGGGGGSSYGGAAAKNAVRRYRRRAREVFEHLPQELCVSVNGYIQGAQKIGSGTSELDLSVNLAETINFIEVFSEQGVRLLLLNADEPPPAGSDEQTALATLSDGRTLELRLKYRSSWPTLHLIYHDPTFKVVEGANVSDYAQVDDNGGDAFPSAPEEAPARARFWKRAGRPVSRLTGRTFDLAFWLRPGAVTAAFAVILAATLLFVELPRGPVHRASAAELLRRSTAAEEATASRRDTVLHRIINLEERKAAGGEIAARRRIEIWQSHDRGIIVRRLYSESGQLMAGEWRKAGGTQILYQRGSKPRVQTGALDETEAWSSIDKVWRLSPSAKDFTALIKPAGRLNNGEGAETYVIGYAGETRTEGTGLVKATLVLRRSDFHAFEQTLVVRHGGETREYRFSEAGFELRPADKVAPAVFEPDKDLLGSAGAPADSEVDQARTPNADSVTVDPKSPETIGAIAPPGLEVEVTYLLDQVKANMGEQVGVTRTPKGTLRVQGIVDTEQRKAQILQSLATVINHPALEVQIETVAEALKRQTQAPSTSVSARQLEVSKEPFPAYSDLRRYFSNAGGLSEDQIDSASRQYAGRLLSRSRQAMGHAWALKQLARRFTDEDLRSLDPGARAKWFSMIRAHAQAFQQETSMIRQEVESVFFRPAAGGAVKDAPEIGNVSELARAIEHLFDLGAAQEKAIRASFTLSTEATAPSAVKTAQFWQSLKSAERLAAKIQGATANE
jgi:DNA-directed RNA polymerase specialized sigma24 family protein